MRAPFPVIFECPVLKFWITTQIGITGDTLDGEDAIRRLERAV